MGAKMLDTLVASPEFWVIVICLVLLALASLAEAALMSQDKLRLRALAEAGNIRARAAEKLIDDRHSLITALVIIINACLLTTSAFVTALTHRLGETHWLPLPLVSLGMIFLILAVFEVTPKALGLRHGERLALALARPVTALVWLFSPFIRLISGLGRALIKALLLPLFGGQLTPQYAGFTEEEFKHLLAVGEQEGELEEEERDMLNAAIEFADKVAREIMVPRPDMVCLPETAPVSEAVELGLRSGFSRLPVYRGDADHIVGVLYVRDLLSRLLEKSPETPVSALMRPPYFVPESKKIDELLRDMQGRRLHLAVVIDEYGDVAGLVTIEDVLEEIVGEIRDEYDQAEEEPLRMLEENIALASARISPDEVAEKFEVTLPEGDFDSLGGFIIAELGRLPEVGDTVEYGPLSFEVETLKEQRLDRIRITRRPETGKDENETE
jgi:putative hemolysin